MNSSRSSVKVTYLDRTKPKRTEQAEVDSDPSSDDQSQPRTSVSRSPAAPKSQKNSKAPTAKADMSSKPPSTSNTKQTPKQVDIRDVPGPAPSKRTRRDSDESRKNSGASKNKLTPHPKKGTTHGRTPSIASLNQHSVKRKSSTTSVTKPPSIGGAPRKLAPKAKSVAPGDGDDEGSIADSVTDSIISISGGRINRTVKDRQEYFTNQSDCAAFGPHRALCSRCNQFVNLNRSQPYSVAPWERHRVKCDQELASDAPLPPNAEDQVNLPVDDIFGEAPARLSASERRAILLTDDRIEVVEEGRVKCAKCTKWVALKKGKPYNLANWKSHRDTCSRNSLPSERILSAERKLVIINDPQVKAFDTTTIECAKCGDKVVNPSGKEYDLVAWESHKVLCRISPETNPTEKVNSVPFPTSEDIKTTSSAAITDSTLAVGGSPNDDVSRVPKRAREEEGDQVAEDERPTSRPRTETYEPPVKESTSALGWFLLPFKSFVRGFRESLTADDS